MANPKSKSVISLVTSKGFNHSPLTVTLENDPVRPSNSQSSPHSEDGYRQKFPVSPIQSVNSDTRSVNIRNVTQGENITDETTRLDSRTNAESARINTNSAHSKRDIKSENNENKTEDVGSPQNTEIYDRSSINNAAPNSRNSSHSFTTKNNTESLNLIGRINSQSARSRNSTKSVDINRQENTHSVTSWKSATSRDTHQNTETANNQRQDAWNDTPVPDLRNNLKPRKVAYKLTYDPNREAGQEYQIEKQSVSDFGDDLVEEDAKSEDNLTIGTDEVSLPIAPDDKSTVYQGERVESANLNDNEQDLNFNLYETDNVQKTNVIVENNAPTPSDVDSRAHTVNGPSKDHENEDFDGRLGSDPAIESPVYAIEKDLTVQSIKTLKTNTSKSPRTLSPSDRGETNILFKDVNSHTHVTSAVNLPEQSPVLQSKEVESRTATRQTDSIPPPNFKSNLFNRQIRISTPKRLARLNRFLKRADEREKKLSVNTENNTKSRNGKSKLIKNEITFIKESRAHRFERMSSTDSIRSLYDKRRRTRDNSWKKRSREWYERTDINKENIEVSVDSKPNGNKMDSIKQIVSKRKQARAQSEKSDRNTDFDYNVREPVTGSLLEGNADVSEKRAINTESVETVVKKAILAKKRLTGANPVTRQGLLTDQNFGKNLDVRSVQTVNSSHIDSDDIFTEEEKRARLRKAQYMNDDLKLVKQRMRNVTKDTRPRSLVIPEVNQNRVQRKAILSNFNRAVKENKGSINDEDEQSDIISSVPPEPQSLTSFKNERTDKKATGHPPNGVFVKPGIVNRGNRPLDTKLSKQNNSTNRKKTQTSEQRNNANNSVNIFNKALNKRRKPGITFKEVKDDVLLHPKIHKMKNRTERKHKTNSNETTAILNQTTGTTESNVANWLMNSMTDEVAKETETKQPKLTHNGSEHKTVIQPSAKSDKPKLKIRLQRRKKRRGNSGNTINSGFYMPLPKPRRRLFDKRGRLYTQVGKVKGYESEIPILYSDAEDDDIYPEPRPLTDTGKNHFNFYGRYEGENDNYRINYRDPAHRKITCTKGALVKFFRNGDPHFNGIVLSINKSFTSFEVLLVYLTGKIATPTGVKHIFKLPEGYEIKSLLDFRDRCVYIVSSTNKLKRMRYGESRENFWSNKKLSAGKVRRDELGLFQRPSSPKEPPKIPPLVVTIVDNKLRERKEKVILNPKTEQSFEGWLRDLHSPGRPARVLYTKKAPHVQITSFSHLFRELRNKNIFIACDKDELPNEIKKRQAPSSNSSTDSINESRNRKKKLPRQQEMGKINENYENGRPVSTSLSRYDYGQRYNPFPGRGPARLIDSRRKDTVEIVIDGVLREFIPPSHFEPEDDGGKPDRLLNPEWVYGFRGRDARQNLLVLPETGELVYYVAAVVVLYSKEKDTQRHYIKHNEEITSMTLHPNQRLIATGQYQGNNSEHGPHIRIWNGLTLSTYSVIGLGIFVGGILSIGFSQDEDGIYLCALDMSEKHVLSVWDWQAERVIARTSTTTDIVHNSCFYPNGPNTSILVTFGVKHIYFWKIFFDAIRKKTEAKIYRDTKSGIFEEDIPESVNCIAWLPSGDIVTGDTNGKLMVWERDQTEAFTCKMIIPAHSLSVMALCLLQDGTLLSGAGTELKAWDTDSNFNPVKARQIPEAAGHIRSIVTQTDGGSDGKVYVATNNSAVLDGSLQLKFKYIIQGHGQGVWGMSPHPFEPTFISAGQDQVVFKWSLVAHKLIWRTHIEAPSTCLAVDHRQDLVVVGTGKGLLIFLNGYSGIHIATIGVGSEPIGCLAFSRDCQFLAMGCEDGYITVFEVTDKDKQLLKSSHVTQACHKAGVAHLDWSTDNRCIQSVDYNHDLIFWNVDTMQQIEITRLVRDVDWYTATCDLAYYMIGPWSNLERGEYIKAVSRSNNRDLMLTGDTYGRLRLYKYPCSKEKADFCGVRVYSSAVTAIAFTPDNRSALTCGGLDEALIQWSLVDDA